MVWLELLLFTKYCFVEYTPCQPDGIVIWFVFFDTLNGSYYMSSVIFDICIYAVKPVLSNHLGESKNMLKARACFIPIHLHLFPFIWPEKTAL